ncbi:hypothetical protein A2U01_0004860 [Trifolium medium]|uniref:Uncharacterized protein n=1 Tax=Trifolium medium TaxID=97028 RepID=A0A392M961_9FABA|nr:hypothetical protein [Trifolium medium]
MLCACQKSTQISPSVCYISGTTDRRRSNKNKELAEMKIEMLPAEVNEEEEDRDGRDRTKKLL